MIDPAEQENLLVDLNAVMSRYNRATDGAISSGAGIRADTVVAARSQIDGRIADSAG